MISNQIVIGFVIFTLITLAIFFIVSFAFHFDESVSVVLAIAGGFGAEILYRKNYNKGS